MILRELHGINLILHQPTDGQSILMDQKKIGSMITRVHIMRMILHQTNMFSIQMETTIDNTLGATMNITMQKPLSFIASTILLKYGVMLTGPPGKLKQLTKFHSNMEILKFMMIYLHSSTLLSNNPNYYIKLLFHMITNITVVTTITVTITLLHHTIIITTMTTIIKTQSHGKII